MARVTNLARAEAETLIDSQGILAAKDLIADLDSPAMAYPFDIAKAARRGILLERLVLPSDARNMLDNPRDENREFSWADHARRYMGLGAKLKGKGYSHVAKLRILQAGHEDWQAELFKDMKKDLSCGEAGLPSRWVYPYEVALGRITLRS